MLFFTLVVETGLKPLKLKFVKPEPKRYFKRFDALVLVQV